MNAKMSSAVWETERDENGMPLRMVLAGWMEPPVSLDEMKCRSCSAAIRWITMRSGKPMPVNAEKTVIVVADEKGEHGVTMTGHISHFATCPNAKEHRRS